MDAAPRELTQGRGGSRLLQDLALLGRLTSGERPSARARLEHALGVALAALLLEALVRRDRPRPGALLA